MFFVAEITMEKISMFCFQCQETAGNKGCSVVGVCGKKATTSNLQDLLIYTAKGIAILRENISLENRKNNRELNSEIDYYLTNALFVTITNANFDDNMIQKEILKGLEIREKVKNQLIQLDIEPKRLKSHDATTFVAETLEEMNKKSLNIGVLSTENEDIRSLREVITYGLKGMAAYYEHAANLGYEKEEIVMFIEKALASTLDDSIGLNELVGLTLETGKYGVDVMALLDSANTGKFGNPEITEVNIGVGKNPGILISGHDLNDIVQLLEQTEGTGVDVYTHSEMLPAHYYPELKKYKHLVGNYGNAWWKQKE